VQRRAQGAAMEARVAMEDMGGLHLNMCHCVDSLIVC
jgi:hypothetical protein